VPINIEAMIATLKPVHPTSVLLDRSAPPVVLGLDGWVSSNSAMSPQAGHHADLRDLNSVTELVPFAPDAGHGGR
jgi:hypothetical protein